MKERYRLVLERVTGPEDDESIEVQATWDLTGKGHWVINEDLMDSIQEELG